MTITLTSSEIQAITGYVRPTQQLRTLHSRGFWRAWVHPTAGVILERAHYDAVCSGHDRKPSEQPAGRPRLHLKAA